MTTRRLENLVRKAFAGKTIKRYSDAARLFRGSQGQHMISNATVRDILLELDYIASQREIKPELSADERAVLVYVKSYRGGVDFGGKGASRKLKVACKQLIDRGYLSGDVRAAWMTEPGLLALKRAQSQKVARNPLARSVN